MDNNNLEEILEKLEKYYKSYGAKKTILNFENDILKLNNPELSYWFSKNIKGSNIIAHEKVILDRKNLYRCYDFPNDKRLTFVESKRLELCYKFARDVKGANIKELEKFIIESKDTFNSNLHYCYLFARDVKGADIKRLEQVVLESKNSFYCYLFATEIKGANKNALKQVYKTKEIFNVKQLKKRKKYL